jgi:diguanylate cyclase (GGDEF)-like protein
MYNVLNCITTEHDWKHVLAALFVLAFSNCCSLIIYHRSQAAQLERNQILWAIAAGLVVGLGVWATHFIALLGYKPGFEVMFSAGRTIVSAMISVAGFVTTALLLRLHTDVTIRMVCACIAAAAVAGMHFFGMTALHGSALIEYDTLTVTAAMVLGFLGYVATYLIGANPQVRWSTPIATITSVLAVIAIHFVSASGTTMIPVRGLDTPVVSLQTGGLSVVIAIAMLVVIVVSAMAAGLDTSFQRLRSKEQRKLAVMADSSSEGLFMVSTSGDVLRTNTAAQIMFSERMSDLDDLNDLGHLSDSSRLPSLVGRAIQDLLQVEDDQFTLRENRDYGERRIRFPDGREMIATVTSRRVEEKDEDFIFFAVHDMTQRVRAEARVRTLAYRDSLTGLPNRIAFNMALESSVGKKAEDRENLAVMIIDLDEFKEVNDQYGHGAGDTLLKAMGRRISNQLSDKDMVARLGGDEFAVLVRGRSTPEAVMEVADRILAAICEPLPMGRRTLTCGGSIGIALVPQRAPSPARILTYADRALYSAKSNGRGCVRFYDGILHKRQMETRNLERALHNAIENNEFVLHFQPKVSATSRAIVGREALIRWNRPGFGLIGPDQFIPLAEQSMLINEIGRWTIYAACDAASRWSGGESIAVNLSARQLLDPDLVDHVRSALEESGLPPSRFELEITETAIIHNTQLATSILLDLKALGIKISLDDFGTGYSSMSYIQEFPFDRIKIDRSFVASMNANKKSRAIVEAIIHLAHSLEIAVVAEGVETEDQAEALALLSCEELQGFLIAAPAPFEDMFARVLADNPILETEVA